MTPTGLSREQVLPTLSQSEQPTREQVHLLHSPRPALRHSVIILPLLQLIQIPGILTLQVQSPVLPATPKIPAALLLMVQVQSISAPGAIPITLQSAMRPARSNWLQTAVLMSQQPAHFPVSQHSIRLLSLQLR